MARKRKQDPAVLKRQRNELNRSRRKRDQDGTDDLWRRMKDLYRGKHYNGQPLEDKTIVNIAFANINVIVPSVSTNYPKFTLNPRTPDDAAGAIIAEEVLNYLWRNYDYQDEFRLAVNDQLQIGHGWVKVGWKQVKEEVAAKPAEDDDNIADVEDEDAEQTVETSTVRFTEDRPI